MHHSIADIARALGAEAEGDLTLRVTGAAEPQSAGPDQLALAMDPRYGDGIAKGGAVAAIVWPGADWRAMGLKAAIFAPRGRLAMSGLTRLMDPGPDIALGIHSLSVVDPTAIIGDGCCHRPLCHHRQGRADRPRCAHRQPCLDRDRRADRP